MKKIMIGIALGGIIFGSIVYAVNTYDATTILYNTSDGNTLNVQEALNDLYSQSTPTISSFNIINTSQTCRTGTTYERVALNNNYTFTQDYSFVRIKATWDVGAPYYSGYVQFRNQTISINSEQSFNDIKKGEVITIRCVAGAAGNTLPGSYANVTATLSGVQLIYAE